MLVDMGMCANPEEADVFIASGGKRRANEKEKCPHCGLWHPGKWKDCFALGLSTGKYPPGWATMPKDRKQRLVDRAELIVPGCTAAHKITVMLAQPPKSSEAKSLPRSPSAGK